MAERKLLLPPLSPPTRLCTYTTDGGGGRERERERERDGHRPVTLAEGAASRHANGSVGRSVGLSDDGGYSSVKFSVKKVEKIKLERGGRSKCYRGMENCLLSDPVSTWEGRNDSSRRV